MSTPGIELDDAELVGTTANARFLLVRPRVIAVVPVPGCVDVAETARASIELQMAYWQSRGEAGGSVIFMDAIVEQDKGARAAYVDLPDPRWFTGFGLVGGTRFGRAVASVFLGLRKPPVPTRFFATSPDAVAWVERRNELHRVQ
ncbi:MAG: hypothetical protein AAF211_23925 [Myxococcota bacterium]